MNVLIAGDSHGCFKLRLFAGFETYPVSLTALLKAYGLGYIAAVDILQMDISLDLSELTFDALVSYQHLSTESDEVGGKRLVQITVTSDLLHRQSREIRVLGLKRRPIINLLKYISDSLRVLEAEFKRISQLNEDCTDSLQRALTNNGEATTPTYEFLQLLVTGLPSPSMDYYLQQELRRDGLKRWNESVRAAHTNIHRVAFECMIPACERLLIHLSDILGCSRWGERYRPLRLEEAAVRDSIKAVGDFVGLIEHLFLVLKVEIKRFSEFENWLERVLEAIEPTVRTGDHIDDGPRVFPPVDYQAVSEYLQSSLSNVGLNAFFRDGNEGSSKEAASLPTNHVIENMHSKLPQSSGSTAKKKSSLSLPLDRHLSLMTRCCLVIFEGPAEAISKSMKVAHTLELLAPAKQSCRRLRLATRYCYYEPDPWYTLALYLAPSTLFPEPSRKPKLKLRYTLKP
ncbi:anaphase-promoting complex, cyclosome, subunit 4-domain-containing protein [Lobosporangium transversale]|uniref:Anaphase-promoting complex subunit 4 n=1 Tax=Lobosporangium transversale TaxID=64571 RepID=A0A1Y2GDK5_9FUNG|nr:anaphase-promoting complex, cyclosome, subunit 4-domain-containing protein [Lobosporangium transversale]ORZ07941.1 anaphase-promoting complex, cyclosome, subunit 4-domain-containing protein [Lobosporangium transversale]|eukprot:XP_021878175.1 anaphase-promoting complex, cyclosome, subunit 4-domain-containing protein [Lobosporangium transversale]